MIVLVDYASPSVFEATRDAASLALATNLRRTVRFDGTVRQHGFNLRIALRALGEAIWSNDTWIAGLDALDPIITVHPDRIFFEAFSQDQSVYAALIVDPAVFDVSDETVCGTTNIDFTAWLWGALGEMRTGRQTRFRVGPEGFEVATAGAGGRFERKVDVPESWVRGFLQVQGAMGLPGTRIECGRSICWRLCAICVTPKPACRREPCDMSSIPATTHGWCWNRGNMWCRWWAPRTIIPSARSRASGDGGD